MKHIALAVGLFFSVGLQAQGVEPDKLQRQKVPPPPWPAGDERGMANQIGPATFQRCAWHMQQPGAKSYDLSQLRSATMPLSPFAGPYAPKPKATAAIPGSVHAFNSEQMNEAAEPAQQGTQFDALGHFGFLREPWDGKPPSPASRSRTTAASRRTTSSPRPSRRCSSSASRRCRRS